MADQPTALEVYGGKSVVASKLARTLVAKLGPDSAPEDWIMAKAQVKEVTTFASELRVAFRESFLERLKTGGDIDVGDGKRWYAGKVKKTTRIVSADEFFEALFTHLGGDIDSLKRCISTGQKTFKQSEVKEVAPKVHAACFETEQVYEIKDGKPVAKKEPRLTR